jgi:hypothetical protein
MRTVEFRPPSTYWSSDFRNILRYGASKKRGPAGTQISKAISAPRSNGTVNSRSEDILQ